MPEKSVLFEAIEAGDSRTVQSLITSGAAQGVTRRLNGRESGGLRRRSVKE